MLAFAGPAAARGATLALQPETARPGDAVLVTVRGTDVAPSGALDDRELAFYPVAGGFRALAALSVDVVPGRLPVAIAVPGANGAAGERVEGSLAIADPHFPSHELAVARRFVEPPPAARRRMRADQKAFDRAFSQAFAPPLFSGKFALPREAERTGRFGDKRTFNGVKKSQHYGDDLEGRMGDPVAAANDGRVVLVRDCYGSGRTVVVWHGARVYSVYFHLSRILVRTGESVRRGQLVGRVGRSGRVTGPHLHWGVKIGDRYVDPQSVLRLDFGADVLPAVAAPAPIPAAPAAAPAAAAPGNGTSP